MCIANMDITDISIRKNSVTSGIPHSNALGLILAAVLNMHRTGLKLELVYTDIVSTLGIVGLELVCSMPI